MTFSRTCLNETLSKVPIFYEDKWEASHVLKILKIICVWNFNCACASVYIFMCVLIFLKIYLFIYFRDGGRMEKERERNVDMWNTVWLPLARTPTGDQACNSGTCPDQESNRWSLALRDNTQPTEPHWPGLHVRLKWRENTCYSFPWVKLIFKST